MGLISTLKEYSKTKPEKLDWESHEHTTQIDSEVLKLNIIKEAGEEVYGFLATHINFTAQKSHFTATTTRFNIINLPGEDYHQIIDLKKINDARFVNKFFEAVNAKLAYQGIFINCVETYASRQKRVLKKYWKPFNYIYNFLDIVFMKVFPKLPLTKKIYFFITKGRNRVLTRAEALGRLYSCGFEVLDEKIINDKLYFVARKIKVPIFDENPSYGLIYKMPRIGKNGKMIGVYKFRTMHPYAEYLQAYIIKKHGYNEAGKPAKDFRLAPWGKWLRRYWLDELPQLINVLKGEMKLVGVRPLSKTRFNEFPEDLQKKRIKFKPGCIPPYVTLLMPNQTDNITAERIYMDEKEKHPYTTDLKYFFKAIYNIITNKIRSA